ncbi:MAG: xanthine phosphoribosyltransferase [Clostridiales bacterium]|nr:xanthine phosphoribosyltransferase [Clostridia bacterium]MCR5353393.1 xanthine phosphoribosyltransferase [Clostridiales bacterium]
MQLLKDRILKDGNIAPGGVLKVDSFLNHQIDVNLLNEIGKEFKRLFSDVKVDKILTIEASGIGIACVAAQYFDVPVVFAKKAKSKNIEGGVFSSKIMSFTYGKTYDVMVSVKFLKPDENILIIDDFLASGKAIIGLVDIVKQAGANVSGVGIVIEKSFQDGGQTLRDMGINLKSLAVIKSMDDEGNLEFED